jgi:hypothetical protein
MALSQREARCTIIRAHRTLNDLSIHLAEAQQRRAARAAMAKLVYKVKEDALIVPRNKLRYHTA